jgi:hypothetical protein
VLTCCREFEAYMDEVKKMPGITGQSRGEVMEWFRTFMEDYNTATMPHEKYYNLEAWEMRDYRERQEEERRQRKRRLDGDDEDDVRDAERASFAFNDEQLVREERKREKEREERRQFEEMKAKIARDNVKREEMRGQEILRNELQVAYRQGDRETVKRLEKRLAPEEERDGIRRSERW